MAAQRSSVLKWFAYQLSRIRTRLLLVNLTVVLIPAAGLEFARIYERQLLDGLERDMRNQAVLVQSDVQASLLNGERLDLPSRESWLKSAAKVTRTRIRVLDHELRLIADSHRDGAPEGPEAPVPRSVTDALFRDPGQLKGTLGAEIPLENRTELKGALAGKLSTTTRVAARPPRVYLFLALPVTLDSRTQAVVYVTRSTHPVLMELRKIRSGLIHVLIVAIALSCGLTLLLAWTLTRPIEHLANAAHEVAVGKLGVVIPEHGGGELTDLGRTLQSMTRRLEMRHQYITQFAADVAHEFKSPLTAIRGAAELLAEGAADDPAARQQFLANIEQDAERLSRLVSRLLELSRIEASDDPFQSVDVGALVLRVAEKFETPDEKVDVDIATAKAFVKGRRFELETAIHNLLDNAIRHGRSELPTRVIIDQSSDSKYLEVRVIDNGRGIAPELQDKIFQRFFTTDSKGKGTGLGLAIVASVAASHHGSVTVSSELTRGTQFVLRLPLQRSEDTRA